MLKDLSLLWSTGMCHLEVQCEAAEDLMNYFENLHPYSEKNELNWTA
jgi:hypothetical protein